MLPWISLVLMYYLYPILTSPKISVKWCITFQISALTILLAQDMHVFSSLGGNIKVRLQRELSISPKTPTSWFFFFLNTDFWFLKDGGSWMWRVIVSFHTLLFIYLLHSTIASLKWKYRKLPRDIKAFTTKDIQILEKVVTLKRLEMMDSGKRYFYNLVQSLHKQSVPGGRDSLLGAVVQFERHLKAKGIFLTGLTVILIPSKKMLSYINNSRESW